MHVPMHKPGFESRMCLMQLSIEDNDLANLVGIEPLVNLMELYAGQEVL